MPVTEPFPVARDPAGAPGDLPPLENGDHLTAQEFDRIYAQRPDIKKAELVNGVVYVAPPVRISLHAEPHGLLTGWASRYCDDKRGIRLFVDGTLLLPGNSRVQPDVMLGIDARCGGTSRETRDNYLQGPVELVTEVAASSAGFDLNEKLDAYRQSGVQEYLVWSVRNREVRWFTLHAGKYVLLPADGGIIKSQVLPGLWLDPEALSRLDRQRIRNVLQAGLDSSEHAAFVQTLQAKLPPAG
jgi:Uma2 family endonuclease